MTGCVDQVEDVLMAVPGFVGETDGLGFDGDTALSLEVHRVENLLLHITVGNGTGALQQAVSECRLTVVDVSDDGEIANARLNDLHRVGCHIVPSIGALLLFRGGATTTCPSDAILSTSSLALIDRHGRIAVALRVQPEIEFQDQMANIESQKKRNRQNEVRRQRNKSINSGLKTSIKKVEMAAAAGELTEDLMKSAQRTIDKATSKGTLHKKTAARKKSRLAKLA